MRFLPLAFLALIPAVSFGAWADPSSPVLDLWQEAQDSLSEFDKNASCVNVLASDGSSQDTISDSLVKNLPCSKLTKENVLTFVTPDAFTENRQVQVQNWSSGVLGQCWSLALYQRRLFYLARFGVPGAKPDPEYALDLVRGTRPERGCTVATSCAEKPTPKRVFPLPDQELYGSGYPSAIEVGAPGQKRTFRSEIERQQERRFYSPSNLGMIWGSRERSDDDNQDTMDQIVKDLKQGRIPLIVIRAARTAQHVVLIKHADKLPDGSYRLTVYDSNVPYRNNVLEYRNHQFHAPEIVGIFTGDYSDEPVGVFLKDEDEMDELQKANYDYYSELCKKLKAQPKQPRRFEYFWNGRGQ